MFADKKRLVVIGDSHAPYCYGGIAEAEIYWLGAITMHRVARDGLSRVLLDKRWWIGWRSVENAILCFGEIDSHAQFEKVAKRQGWTIDAVIDDLIDRYLRSLCSHPHHAKFSLSCVVPPAPSDDAYQDTMRRRVNRRLAQWGAERGFRFVDFYGAVDISADGRHVDDDNTEPICEIAARALGAQLTYRQPVGIWTNRIKRRWPARNHARPA